VLAQPTKWLTEGRDSKSSIYSGFVVSNKDPLKLGRITVRIEEFYGDNTSGIPDADLPWLHQGSGSFLGNGVDSIAFTVPDIGTKVNVEYPTSTPYFGYYQGGSNSTDVKNSFFDEDYPNSYGFKDGKGNYFKINKTSGITEVGHSSGTTLSIDLGGNVTTNAPTITYNGDVYINGNLHVSSGFTGSFTTLEGYAVTVVDGVIVNIA
jgi:hypothetical protein